MTGPYSTEREARLAAHAIVSPAPGSSVLGQAQNLQLLRQACAAAGAEIGPYDARILNWLARWEDSTVAVVAGLITRAHTAGRADGAAAPAVVTLAPAQLATVLDALADAETYREREGSARCTACEEAPPSAGLCAEHSADFDAAQAYHDLTTELTGGAR